MYRLEPNRRRTSKQQYRSITRGATPTPGRYHHVLARTTAATRQVTHKYLRIPHCEHIRYFSLHPPWQSRIVIPRKADMAQLVEHNLAKVGVAGSSPVVRSIACGHGSVGRAQPCQGWGRGFEPRCPLHCIEKAGRKIGFFYLYRLSPIDAIIRRRANTRPSRPQLRGYTISRQLPIGNRTHRR